jgi:hypothetical protein
MTELQKMKIAHDYFNRSEWILIARVLRDVDEAAKRSILQKMPLFAVGLAMDGRKELV